jgi:hypothetical protein
VPIPHPVAQSVKLPPILGVRDTLHNVSSTLVQKLVTSIPKPISVADSTLARELRHLSKTILEASEPSWWDYSRDGASILIAFVSVYVAYRLAQSQRRQQIKDTRLAWIRLFIIEPQSASILGFFSNLETILAGANRTQLSITERASIASAVNSSFNKLDKDFLSYTDSIENSTLPQKLREIAETQRDDLADLIDLFDDNDPVGSYRKLVDRATLGRNKFLSALYSLSFE